ncbi:MAG: sensor histidine kinase, partial [Pseudomonadota bacterium]
ETLGEVEIAAEFVAGQVRIFVRDDGPGVPPRAQAHLFEPFKASTRPGGSGLGLAIARELARGHGGDVVLDKTDTEGTIFRVTLPVHAGAR